MKMFHKQFYANTSKLISMNCGQQTIYVGKPERRRAPGKNFNVYKWGEILLYNYVTKIKECTSLGEM